LEPNWPVRLIGRGIGQNADPGQDVPPSPNVLLELLNNSPTLFSGPNVVATFYITIDGEHSTCKGSSEYIRTRRNFAAQQTRKNLIRKRDGKGNHPVKWQAALLGLIATIILVTYWRIARRPAFRQKPDEVVIREPGMRILGVPQPVASEARKDLDFAWLSQAAYGRAPDGREKYPAGCPDADSALRRMGWSRWDDFPDAGLRDKIAKFHLRVEVSSNSSDNAVGVAFGGTVFSNWKDWKSNFRWFTRRARRDDEYTEIVKEFGPAFIREFVKRKEYTEWAFLQHAQIFATGHSLGGGLAQEFAYSLPIDPRVPRISKVFAFDPSPVTGFYSLDQSTRYANSQNLAIDRIYERGEILALLRSLENFVYPPSASAPAIRQVRYNLFHSHNPIAGHSIAELACKLDEASR
jgi:hypothetical protein